MDSTARSWRARSPVRCRNFSPKIAAATCSSEPEPSSRHLYTFYISRSDFSSPFSQKTKQINSNFGSKFDVVLDLNQKMKKIGEVFFLLRSRDRREEVTCRRSCFCSSHEERLVKKIIYFFGELKAPKWEINYYCAGRVELFYVVSCLFTGAWLDWIGSDSCWGFARFVIARQYAFMLGIEIQLIIVVK